MTLNDTCTAVHRLDREGGHTAEQQAEPGRALVVDDELVVREIVGRMLTAKGCTVDVAVNGEEGLAKAKEGSYDVVVTDIKMPKMDGFGLIENLKAHDPEVPVIIVTAVGDVQNAVKAVRLGAYDFIHKPFGNGSNLWHTVARAIELRRTRRQNKEYQHRLEQINKQFTRELEMARSVQESFAAKSLIPDKGLDVAALYEPCLNIGGDLYGTLPIGKQEIALYMADVAGHGPAAALITAMIKVNIDSIADRDESHGLLSAPHGLLSELDRSLAKCMENGMFVTMFYGVLDCKAGRLTYCNAGHCPPMLLKAGAASVDVLDKAKNMALTLAGGMGFGYKSDTIDFQPGDVLVLYTDGLVEAGEQQDERFGMTRLAEAIASCSTLGAQEIVQEISLRLRSFLKGMKPHDDVAILVARRGECVQDG